MNIKELKEILDILADKKMRVLINIKDERNNKNYITNIEGALVEHGTVKLYSKIKKRGK